MPTGNGVMYGEGGMVFISGVAIMSGSWPAPSPDGTKIAADGDGVVVLANADGSGESEGPAGPLRSGSLAANKRRASPKPASLQ